MANAVEDLVYVPAGTPFDSICSISIFSINLTFYLIFSTLVVFTIYKIAMAIYHVTQADSSEVFEKLKENVTDIIISIIGLLIISSAIFFPKMILQTMGVADAKNPFTNLGGCQ